MYKILDLHHPGIYFADAEFSSLEEIKKQLVDFHNENSAEDSEDFSSYNLQELLNFGQWGIEDSEGNTVTLGKQKHI